MHIKIHEVKVTPHTHESALEAKMDEVHADPSRKFSHIVHFAEYEVHLPPEKPFGKALRAVSRGKPLPEKIVSALSSIKKGLKHSDDGHEYIPYSPDGEHVHVEHEPFQSLAKPSEGSRYSFKVTVASQVQMHDEPRVIIARSTHAHTRDIYRPFKPRESNVQAIAENNARFVHSDAEVRRKLLEVLKRHAPGATINVKRYTYYSHPEEQIREHRAKRK